MDRSLRTASGSLSAIGEVGDRNGADGADDHDCECPDTLRAPDLLSRASYKIRQCGQLQDALESGADQDEPPRAWTELVPPLLGHQPRVACSALTGNWRIAIKCACDGASKRGQSMRRIVTACCAVVGHSLTSAWLRAEPELGPVSAGVEGYPESVYAER